MRFISDLFLIRCTAHLIPLDRFFNLALRAHTVSQLYKNNRKKSFKYTVSNVALGCTMPTAVHIGEQHHHH